MFHNYILIAIRNLARDKVYSVINISGLAIGMAAAFLILLWVKDEVDYDRFHGNAKSIYRLICESRGSQYAVSHAPMARTLAREIPEVIEGTRISIDLDTDLIQYKDIKLQQMGKAVDTGFFNIFSFPFIKGDPRHALSDPWSIVITEDMAFKLFGSEDPIDKVIHFNNQETCRVSGVIQNLPHNSHLQFDFLRLFDDESLQWNDWSYYTYILLQPNSSMKSVSQKVNDCYFKHRPEKIGTLEYRLQPVTRIHLFSNFKFDVPGQGDIKYVTIFSLIAAFILFIACTNYMNLATARSTRRIKEIGLRKVIGANKFQLISQFVGESLVVCMISGFVSFLLIDLFLPFINTLTGKDLKTGLHLIPVLLLIICVIGLLAGSYPALSLSSLKPIHALKGSRLGPGYRSMIRKVLVVVQFLFSTILIIGTIVVFDQLNFLRNAKLGFDKENLITLTLNHLSKDRTEVLKNILVQHPDILSITASDNLPIEQLMNGKDKGKVKGFTCT